MPRSPEQNREIREKRIQQILDATLCVYRERGYHGTEMGAIARQAGLGRGLIYYYFKDKQDVFLTLIRQTLELWKVEVDPLLNSDRPVAEKLAEYLRMICYASLEYPDIYHLHQSITRDIKVLFPEREKEVYGYYENNMFQPLRNQFLIAAESGEIGLCPEVAERFFFSVLFEAVSQDYPRARDSVEEMVKAALYGLVGSKKGKPE
ncbi:TetR/AcrR family transcriptional regulator [Salinithrix halophila]